MRKRYVVPALSLICAAHWNLARAATAIRCGQVYCKVVHVSITPVLAGDSALEELEGRKGLWAGP